MLHAHFVALILEIVKVKMPKFVLYFDASVVPLIVVYILVTQHLKCKANDCGVVSINELQLNLIPLDYFFLSSCWYLRVVCIVYFLFGFFHFLTIMFCIVQFQWRKSLLWFSELDLGHMISFLSLMMFMIWLFPCLKLIKTVS